MLIMIKVSQKYQNIKDKLNDVKLGEIKEQRLQK